jgi:cellobiose phosphorylase
LPTRLAANEERARHGLGYSKFCRQVNGIETVQTMFVHPDANGECWIVEIVNRSDRPRSLRFGTYFEWFLGNQGDWHREFHRLFIETECDGNLMRAWKHPGLREGSREQPETGPTAFLRIDGMDPITWISDRYAFLGKVGSIQQPVAMTAPLHSVGTGRWDDPVGAGLADFQLAPGEMRVITITLGVDSADTAYRNPVIALEETKRYWQSQCDQKVSTGVEAIDRLANSWLPYQAIAGRLMARCAYYQQGGAYGYRDQLQDSLMLLQTDPERCLWQLKQHAEAMYEDGSVRHWWFPTAPIWTPSHHSDTCCWLAYGLLSYIEVTGDVQALNQEVHYLSRDTQAFSGTGFLLDHAWRGIQRALSFRSDRGLPLILGGDWNDGLSHVGIDRRGESVWMAMFVYDILRRWVPILDQLGERELLELAEREAEALRVAVETHGWDGEWYVAGFRDDGQPFGSRSNQEGQIYLNPQTWSVISGLASPERARIAMNAVRQRLVKPYGALLLTPAYTQVDPYIGYISRYAPGLRENGGVYSHASTWAVQAFAMMGEQDTARAIYTGMLPNLRSEKNADLYAAEPYVMPGNVDGPDSPYEGRAGWTWYTGSAAWMVRIARRYLSSPVSSESAGDQVPSR